MMYYGHDHLYSPVLLAWDTGTPVERYEYVADPWRGCLRKLPDHGWLVQSAGNLRLWKIRLRRTCSPLQGSIYSITAL
ncbi:MAG: hypothetical protein ISS79_00425 [Phycisphaerae bacterium]|nr:hypothetical protein [Phycisphaerae bacterium]